MAGISPGQAKKESPPQGRARGSIFKAPDYAEMSTLGQVADFAAPIRLNEPPDGLIT
jgi:hypothetical protein